MSLTTTERQQPVSKAERCVHIYTHRLLLMVSMEPLNIHCHYYKPFLPASQHSPAPSSSHFPHRNDRLTPISHLHKSPTDNHKYFSYADLWKPKQDSTRRYILHAQWLMACCKSFHLKHCHFCSSTKKRGIKITCSNAIDGCKEKAFVQPGSSKFSCLKSLQRFSLREDVKVTNCKTPQAILQLLHFLSLTIHSNLHLQPGGSFLQPVFCSWCCLL